MFYLIIEVVHGTISFPNQISDDMIIQREPLEAWLWGRSSCTPGSFIKLEMVNTVTNKLMTSKRVKTDSNTEWEVKLGAFSASTDHHTITVSDCDGSQTLQRVMIGEVILCAGQSNMYWTLRQDQSTNGPTDVYDVISTRANEFPHLRIFSIQKVVNFKDTNVPFDLPPTKCAGQNARWTNYNTVCDNIHSAVCMATIMELTDIYRDKGITMPVGAVNIGRSGATLSSLTPTDKDARDDLTCGGTGLDYFKIPFGGPDADIVTPGISAYGVYYFKLVVPVGRMTFRHMALYQGERENRMDHVSKPPIPRYSCTQGIFINELRQRHFNNPDLSVSVTGLPGDPQVDPFQSNRKEYTREAQATALASQNAIYVPGEDQSNRQSKGSAHPPFKYNIGQRHAYAAARSIGDFQINDRGPISTKQLTIETDSNGKQYIRIAFDPMTSHALTMKPTRNCISCCTDSSPFSYESGNSDRFFPVPFNLVTLDVAAVYIEIDRPLSEITGIAMHWVEAPQCMLYNDWGCEVGELPGTLFRIRGITSIPTGSTPPGTTAPLGDKSRCPQYGFPPPTPSPTKSPTTSAPTKSPQTAPPAPTPPPVPTKSPTRKPSAAPTRAPTPKPTIRPTLPPGDTLFTTVSEGVSFVPFNVHCSNVNTRLSNRQKQYTELDIGGRLYTYGIDGDGAYNSIPMALDPSDIANWDTEKNTAASLPDNDPSTFTLGPFTNNLQECKDRCEQFEHCTTIVWDELTGECNMALHCKAIFLQTGFANRIVQFRKSFGDSTGFHADAVTPGSTCEGTPLNGPTRLGKTSEPITIQECYDHCQPILTVTHFVIDDELRCSCYGGCVEEQDMASNTYKIHLSERTTLAPTRFPTKSPTTPEPTKNPTRTPTKNPTKSPTKSPTKNPTRSPTKNPTKFPTYTPTFNPTYSPTGAPTAMPGDQRFFYDAIRNPYIVGGAYAVTIVIIILLI